MTHISTPSGGRVPAGKANFERFERPRSKPGTSAARVSDDELPISRRTPGEGDLPDGLRWEDPPAASWGRQSTERKLAGQLAELRQNPARWARLANYRGATSANSAATRLRKATTGYEFQSARVSGGSALWGRYLGKGPSS